MKKNECFTRLVCVVALAEGGATAAAKQEWEKLPKDFRVAVLQMVEATIEHDPKPETFILKSQYGDVRIGETKEEGASLSYDQITKVLLELAVS